VDTAGDLFISDYARVREVDSAGTITTIAGDGTDGSSGDGGPATSALVEPSDVAVDTHGDLFLAECGRNQVRMINPAGTISTVAGSGLGGFSGDGEPATSARLSCPRSILVDAHNDLVIADSGNNRIREVDLNEVTPKIETIAGTGSNVSSGDGGKATLAGIGLPDSLALDKEEHLYVTESGGAPRVREISPSGIVSTFAGTEYPGDTGVGMNSGDGGPATAAHLREPLGGVAADGSGNVYIASGCLLRRVDPGGTITTVSGGIDECGFGPFGCAARSAEFEPGAVGPGGALAVDGEGNVFISFTAASRVLEYEPMAEPPAGCTETPSPPCGCLPLPPPPPPCGCLPPPPLPCSAAYANGCYPLPHPKPISPTAAFSLPSAKQCVSKRKFKIHVRTLPGITWVSAVIKVNHKPVKILGRSHITALVNLVGLPKGTFVLSITAKATDGQSVTGTRTYHTCVPKRRSHYPAPKL